MEEECSNEENLKEVEQLDGDIEFKNVSFAYGTRGRAIEGISLKIPAGKKSCICRKFRFGKNDTFKTADEIL